MNWTMSKVRRLREIYRTRSNAEIAAEFGMNRTAIAAAARRFGIRKVGPVTAPAAPPESQVVSQLKSRIEDLEDLMGLTMKMPTALGLSEIEMKFVGVLVRRPFASRSALYEAVYGDLPEAKQPQEETINVHISKIRRKLAPRGHKIRTSHGVGYYMDDKSRAELKSMSVGAS